ncbi:MAG: polymer-forming cytoskeletal protein [Gammaproteobacteria bacterium]|nr:polymer-forming cytoskeletal protein [Gammaproteobacteria bacterium]
MFGKRKKIKASKIDSLIGRHTELFGDVRFSGWLHVDGTVKGNVMAEDDSSSVLTLSEHGTIEGEVRVPNVVLNGVVLGDVHAREQIELASNARIKGNVYYRLIEMAMGAEVNGNLVHRGDEDEEPAALEQGPTLKMAEET